MNDAHMRVGMTPPPSNGPCRGEEFVESRCGVVADADEDILEVLVGVDVVQQARVAEGLQRGEVSAGLCGTNKEVVLASDSNDPQRPLRDVVVCAVKGAFFHRGEKPRRRRSLQPEALEADQEVTNGLKHFEKRPR